MALLQACLNGGRSRSEHPAVPLTATELARDALAARQAGALAAHLHPRREDGLQTLRAADCEAAVGAVRAAAPGMPIGLSTAESIDPDPFSRAASLSSWRVQPDYVSVNVSESGWTGVARAALSAGIAVEAGLANRVDAEEFSRSAFVHRVLRVLVEVAGGPDDARTLAELIPSDVKQLWHGYGPATWEVIRAGEAAGHDIRVGLEDTIVLADGRSAASNAELVAAAASLIRPVGEAQ